MALTTTISQKELERVTSLAYEGETLKVMLCSVGVSGFTAESTVTEWQTLEQSGNGYVRFSTVIPEGAYDPIDGRYEIPPIDAAFSATTPGYLFDRIIVYIDGATHIHSLIIEDPNITLSGGQTQTYRITLVCDD
jgi:hypothetical protein